MVNPEHPDEPEPYWTQEAVNARLEWDEHERAMEEGERDWLNRDDGERPGRKVEPK